MIDIEVLNNKVVAAQAQKQNLQYKSAIQAGLSKPDWERRRAGLNNDLNVCSNVNDFERYQRSLLKLLNDLIEEITAPGVDSFIDWINMLTDNKSKENAKALRNHLVANFSNAIISSKVKSILESKNVLDVENSIFNKLLIEVRKNFKKRCIDFIDDKQAFANKIDDFLSKLESDLIGLGAIDGLTYTDVKQLYSPEQIKNNIDWYSEIVSDVIEKNQSLKPIDDTDKTKELVVKVNSRISDIKAVISILDNSKVANKEDDAIKNLFFKFKEDMIKYEGGVKRNLEEFMGKQWNVIESNYSLVNSFFANISLVEFQAQWNEFQQKEQIEALLSSFKAVVKENPIPNLLKHSNFDIQDALNKKATSINRFEKSCLSLKTDIIEEFQKTIAEYETNKVPQLDGILKKEPKIKSTLEDLKEQLQGLKNSKKSLEADTDVLCYLKDRFSEDLSTYYAISSLFKKALQESGKSPHLKWLDEKLSGAKTSDLNETDFNDPILIKELMSAGLIKVKLEKQF